MINLSQVLFVKYKNFQDFEALKYSEKVESNSQGFFPTSKIAHWTRYIRRIKSRVKNREGTVPFVWRTR